MTFRSRSCVIGRGVDTFSICSAMALASKMPTQIGSTRCPSLSRRITIGMFVMGSTISPLMVISICINPYNLGITVTLSIGDRPAPHAVRAGALHPDGHRPADPRRRSRQVHDHVAARAASELRVAAPADGV